MRPIRFGLIGEYQSGKSLFVNCLLQRSVATVGGGDATTHTVVNYQYGEQEYVKYLTNEKQCSVLPINELNRLDTATNILVADVYLKNDFLKHFILTDMPGFGANVADNEVARTVLPNIDFAILIAWSEKTFGNDSDSYKSLRTLKEYHIPYFFLLNCTKIERWRCDDEGNLAIANQDMSMMSFYPPEIYPLQENGLNIVNLMWYWYSICEDNDELINRRANKRALDEYGIEPSIKEQLRDVSNFNLIKRLFDMEHREYLELKRSIKEEIDALKRELCPIGTIQTFAFNRIPEGWMACDGRVLHINDFRELYDVIGNTFGGDGKTQFVLPDLRGRFVRGWNSNANLDPKRKFGSYQDDAIQEHKHKLNMDSSSTGTDGSHTHILKYEDRITVYDAWGESTANRKTITDSSYTYSFVHNCEAILSSGNHCHSLPTIHIADVTALEGKKVSVGNETRPHNIALMFCIKAR